MENINNFENNESYFKQPIAERVQYPRNVEKISLYLISRPKVVGYNTDDPNPNNDEKCYNSWLCTPDGSVICAGVVLENRVSEKTFFRVQGSEDIELTCGGSTIQVSRLSSLIAKSAAEDPDLCGHIPADVYQNLPTLSQEILTEYQKRVLEENASMPAGEDRTPLVERVRKEVAEMNRVFDNAEKSKPDNLFADVSFERKK